jgi:hypothetical protein
VWVARERRQWIHEQNADTGQRDATIQYCRIHVECYRYAKLHSKSRRESGVSQVEKVNNIHWEYEGVSYRYSTIITVLPIDQWTVEILIC